MYYISKDKWIFSSLYINFKNDMKIHLALYAIKSIKSVINFSKQYMTSVLASQKINYRNERTLILIT